MEPTVEVGSRFAMGVVEVEVTEVLREDVLVRVKYTKHPSPGLLGATRPMRVELLRRVWEPVQ